MVLKLEVANDPSRREPTVFRDAGGTIGRLASCTLTLPDPFVSSSHARIIYRAGKFLIEDTSSNGICVNSQSNRLGKGQPYELASGDMLLIDPYVVKVTIEDAATVSPKGSGTTDPFGLLDVNTGENPLIDGPSGKRKKQDVRRVDDLVPPDPERRQFRPPDPILPPEPDPEPEPNGRGALIPEDPRLWQTNPGVPVPPVGGKTQPPGPVDPTPLRPQPAPPLDGPRMTGELSEVLKGAGLPSDIVTPELARDFGRILRTVVSGLIEVLKSRQMIKDEFRMHQTKIQTTGNNPLKFSANLEDAMHRLLLQKNRAYLEPVDAFEDAFADLLDHQTAMLAGMRAAFEATLKAFDPDVLQADFDKRGKSGLMSGPAKLRYWDQYRATFGDMVRDADCFQNLFGEEFANAYDEQLERSRDQRQAPPPPSGKRPGRS
jgi:type VI secretion system FHA domain protein